MLRLASPKPHTPTWIGYSACVRAQHSASSASAASSQRPSLHVNCINRITIDTSTP